MSIAAVNQILLRETDVILERTRSKNLFMSGSQQMYIITHDGFNTGISEHRDLLDFVFIIPQELRNAHNTTPFDFLSKMAHKNFPIRKKHITALNHPPQGPGTYASIIAVAPLADPATGEILDSLGIYPILRVNLTEEEYKYASIFSLYNFKIGRFSEYVIVYNGDENIKILFKGYS